MCAFDNTKPTAAAAEFSNSVIPRKQNSNNTFIGEVPKVLCDKAGTSVLALQNRQKALENEIWSQIAGFQAANGRLPSRRELTKIAKNGTVAATQALREFRDLDGHDFTAGKNHTNRTWLHSFVTPTHTNDLVSLRDAVSISDTISTVPQLTFAKRLKSKSRSGFTESDSVQLDDLMCLFMRKAKCLDVWMLSFDVPNSSSEADVEVCSMSNLLLQQLADALAPVMTGDLLLRWERNKNGRLHLHVLMTAEEKPQVKGLQAMWLSVLPPLARKRAYGGDYTSTQVRVDVTEILYFDAFRFEHTYLAKRSQTFARQLPSGGTSAPESWYAASSSLVREVEESVFAASVSNIQEWEITDGFETYKSCHPEFRWKSGYSPWLPSSKFASLSARFMPRDAQEVRNALAGLLGYFRASAITSPGDCTALVEVHPISGRLSLRIKRPRPPSRRKRKSSQ